MDALKPQDVVIALKLAPLEGAAWTYAELARSLHLSPATVHEAVGRLTGSRLFEARTLRRVVRPRLLELLVHGIPYVFPTSVGPPRRGLPTGISIPLLADKLLLGEDDAMVWPMKGGPLLGRSIEPLYRSVPAAAVEDIRLHEALALVDALRVGRARERNIAAAELKARLHA
jgi:AraC-like DNA-binding protein